MVDLAVSNVVSLLGGVALFLFGMLLMGDGLKKVAGNKLELVLYKLSSTPLKGVILGTGVTAVIQSSSATSVMVVGFVNSGMMKLRQAISVILGALIGTSVTGWIICLSSIQGSGWVSLLSTSTLAALVAVVGIVLRMFSKNPQNHHVGDILLGFAVLMFGMQSMSAAVSPLRDSPAFIGMLTTFSNPVVGILVGTAITSVLQSASAAVGILQALSMTGAVTFSTALPITLGIAIGAAVPVLLSALGAKTDGKRTAFAYLAIEILGVVICGGVFYALNAVFRFPIMSRIMTPVSTALLNTLFRVATTLVLMPLLDKLVWLVTALIKESEEERTANAELDRLDARFLAHPALAVEQSRISINRMADYARSNILTAMGLVDSYSAAGAKSVEVTEDRVDLFEDRLGTYLMRLTANELDSGLNARISEYLHTLSDFERISDHAMNVSEVALEIHEKHIVFSPAAMRELAVLSSAIKEILQLSIDSFISEDLSLAFCVEPLEERIDILCDEIKLRHVERLQRGDCSLSLGFVFNDILTNYERVADHCSNIAIAMIELKDNVFDTHGYVINLKELHSHNFDTLYEEYCAKYQI